jgi:hypothetical protein
MIANKKQETTLEYFLSTHFHAGVSTAREQAKVLRSLRVKNRLLRQRLTPEIVKNSKMQYLLQKPTEVII